MRKITHILIILSSFFLSENAHGANYIKKEPDGILELPTETQEAEVRKLDTELSKRIHDRLSDEWSSRAYRYLGVKVNNGVVSLNGLVQTENDRKRVEERIKNIPGVRSLNSHIKVIHREDESMDNIDSQDDLFDLPIDENMNKKH